MNRLYTFSILLFIVCKIFFVPSNVLAQTCQTNVTSCCEITSSGTYTLNSGGSFNSQAGCFSVRADNVTLDLNSQTVNYAQSAQGVGVFIAGGIDNVDIKNGKLIGGFQPYSNAITSDGNNNNVKIHGIEASTGGLQTEGFVIAYGDNLEIYDNIIELNSIKEDPCSHYGGHIAGIGISGRGETVHIYNNQITGKAMRGIAIGGCYNWAPDNPQLIYNNYISLESMINDGYGISMEGLHNVCSDGTKIFNNVINQINGRGIIIAGWNENSDYGPGNVEIYENTVSVQEGSDCEGEGSTGLGVGMRIRFGAHDIFAHDNYISALAGQNVGVNHSTNVSGGKAIGMFLSHGNPYGTNNRYENNYIDVKTTDADLFAIGVHVSGGNPNIKTMPSFFKNNTIRSNNKPISSNFGGDGAGYNASFDGDKIIKGNNPINFKSITLGFWWWGTTGYSFNNILGESGTSIHDMEFVGTSEAVFEDIDISWTLKIAAKDSGGNPIDGAAVQILGARGDTHSGSTENNGIFKIDLLEMILEGIGASNVSSIDYDPYHISVSYNGNTIERDVVLNISKTETFIFAGGGEDVTPPQMTSSETSSVLPPDATEILVKIETDEDATCKMDMNPDANYTSMTKTFDTTGNQNHQVSITDFDRGQSYFYYVKCKDVSGNSNSAPLPISLWAAHYFEPQEPNPVDTIPPVAIGDLTVDSCGVSACALSWTAPGDDGGTGAAHVYDIRYSNIPITNSLWDNATQVTGEISPSMAGVRERMTVSGLTGNMTYFFAIKAADEVYNWSSISNNIAATTPVDYICGDADNNGIIDLADIMYLIENIFKGGPAPEPFSQGDADGDGAVNVSDLTFLINYLYKGGPAPQCSVPGDYVEIGLGWTEEEVMRYLEEAMGNSINPQLDGNSSGYSVFGGCGNLGSPETRKLPMSFVFVLSLMVIGITFLKLRRK